MRTFISFTFLSLFLSTVSSAPLSACKNRSSRSMPTMLMRFIITVATDAGPVPFPVIDEADLEASRFQPPKLFPFAAQKQNPAVVAAFERLTNGATPRLGRRELQPADIKVKRQDPHLGPTATDTEEASPVDEAAPAATTTTITGAKE
ncbi:MAG: hypothetical protein Q9183_005719, partial [Haloplaca sp. 2 TL-2023]